MKWILMWMVVWHAPLTTIDELYKKYDFEWTTDSATGRELITAPGFKLVVAPGISTVLLNSMPLSFTTAPALERGELVLPPELVSEIRRRVPVRGSSSTPTRPAPGPIVKKFPPLSIVIDPGHGGKFSGGEGSQGLVEKNVNLDVALRLQKLLEAGGVQVALTRTTDRHFSDELYADLQHRCDLSNRLRPDLFLSIHSNSAEDSRARGFEVWIPTKALRTRNRASRRVAGVIRQELKKVIGNFDRGTKEKNYYVLRNTQAPAVLVEMEFLSHPAAERKLALPAFRQRIAEALAESLRDFAEEKGR